MKALIILTTLLVGWSARANAATVSYAIVIGNNAPPATTNLAPLRYADDDAVRYYQLFARLGRARLLATLDETTQRRYPGLGATAEPPTLANLRLVVKDYAAAMAADRRRGDSPVLYFTFSGHGAVDGEGVAFLAMLDGPLTEDVLYDEVLAQLPATYSHVIIDACHAGGVVGVRGGGFFASEVDGKTTTVSRDDALPVLQSRRLARFPQVGVIVATTLGQEAHEWSELESGVFTHEVISGLLGPADINGDGIIEYSELQAFVAAANRNVEDPRAILHVIAHPPAAYQNAPLVVLSTLRNTRRLSGELGALGHFYVELDNGQRYLDAHLARGANAVVALPDDTGAFVRTDSGEARVPAGAVIALDTLRLTPRSTAARGSIESSYRSAMFSAVFGRDYYQGYVDSVGAIGVSFPDAARAAHDEAARPSSGARWAAIGATALAGGSAVACITTAILAVEAKSDFNATNLQKPAHDAEVRYQRDLTISIATGATAVAAGAIAWWLWPDSSSRVVPSTSGHGEYAISVEGSW